MSIRHVATLVLLVATGLCSSLSGIARTLPAVDDEQTVCQADASRLCQDFVPDMDQITACMMAKRKQLSPACRNALDAGMRKRAHGN